MSRLLLLTDSNFVNNIGVYKGPRIRNLDVKSCQSRKAIMQELSTIDDGIIVLSCLDMMASDIAKTTLDGADAAVEVYINQLVFKIVERMNKKK